LVSFITELAAGFSASKAPVDFDSMTIHSSIPSPRFPSQFAQRGNAPSSETLPTEQADCDAAIFPQFFASGMNRPR